MRDPANESPVFFDPDQRRWPLVRSGFLSLGIVLGVLFGLLVVSVVLNPVLPSLGLHPGAPSRAPRPFPAGPAPPAGRRPRRGPGGPPRRPPPRCPRASPARPASR